MAEHNPTRINRTGGTGKVQEFIPGTDTLSGSFLTDRSVDTDQIANDAITRLKMANLSVGPRELIGQAVDFGNYGNDSIGIQKLAFEAGTTETTGFVLAIGASEQISDASQEIGSSTATTFRLIDPADFGGGGGGGVTSGGFGLDVTGARVDLDYTDPEILFTLSKQTPIKTFNRTNGQLTSIDFELPPASGTGNNIEYTQTFTRNSSGVLESITIGLRATPLVALAIKNFDRTNGVLTGIRIT